MANKIETSSKNTKPRINSNHNISKLILGLSFQGIPGIAGPKGFMGLCGCDGEKV